MKKRILILFALVASLCANAQVQTEINVGLPTGDAADIISFGVDVRANYMFPVTDEFKLGPSVGLLFYVGKEDSDDGEIYLPVSLRGEYTFSERFVTGLDVGYAFRFSLEEEGGNGVYFKPTFGYLITERFAAQVSYSVISADGGSLSHFGLGFVFSK